MAVYEWWPHFFGDLLGDLKWYIWLSDLRKFFVLHPFFSRQNSSERSFFQGLPHEFCKACLAPSLEDVILASRRLPTTSLLWTSIVTMAWAQLGIWASKPKPKPREIPLNSRKKSTKSSKLDPNLNFHWFSIDFHWNSIDFPWKFPMKSPSP